MAGPAQPETKPGTQPVKVLEVFLAEDGAVTVVGHVPDDALPEVLRAVAVQVEPPDARGQS